MWLPPAVAACRQAVRSSISDLSPGTPLIVACSGGADSLALVSAVVFEAHKRLINVVGVTIDHGLQPGSADQAERVADQMTAIGVAEVRVERVVVGSVGGPEAAARTARYAALARIAGEHAAHVVMLGHTRDDQAETVLLGLARGSGARSLSGMARVSGIYRRPLLQISRAETVAACHAEGIEFWSDPQNDDPAFTRVRIRNEVLPVLERELGPGVAESLARTARLLRDDADALDALADTLLVRADLERGRLAIGVLVAEPAAVRRRVLRLAALGAGCPGSELFLVHVDALDALLMDWHGQGPVQLPGHVLATRAGGTLIVGPGPVAG